jgi:hypothetical protein
MIAIDQGGGKRRAGIAEGHERERQSISPRTREVGDTMRTTRILLAAGCVGAIALGTLVPAKAQYYSPQPPDYGFASPPPDTRYGYGWTWNDCPPGWTVQGGNCVPYGWRAWGRPSGKRRRPINAARR